MKEAQQELGRMGVDVSDQTVRTRIHDGILQGFRVGRKMFTTKRALRDMLYAGTFPNGLAKWPEAQPEPTAKPVKLTMDEARTELLATPPMHPGTPLRYDPKAANGQGGWSELVNTGRNPYMDLSPNWKSLSESDRFLINGMIDLASSAGRAAADRNDQSSF